MPGVQITVRCEKDKDHAKILRWGCVIDGMRKELAKAKEIAAVLDGSSAKYMRPPGDLSPIGICAICRGKLTCEVKQIA